MNTRWLTILSLGLLLGGLPTASAALANNLDAVRLLDSGNRTVYRLRYFDFENVNNLEQLLDQIPDLQHALDDSLLDTEYRVLINGNVVGSAPRDLNDIGRQFSLGDIKRIVVLRAPAALEYAGILGPAINITLTVEADRSVGRWEANAPLGHARYAEPNVSVNYGNRPGDWEYQVFVSYLPNHENRQRKRMETYLDPDDLQPTQQRLTTYDDSSKLSALGGSVDWRLNERLNLQANSRVSERRRTRNQELRFGDPGGEEQLRLTQLEDDIRMSETGLATMFQLTPAIIWETRLGRIEERRDKVVAKGQAVETGLLLSAATRSHDQRLEFSSAISKVTVAGSESSLALYATQRSRDALSAISLNPLRLEAEAEIIENRFDLVAQYGWKPRPNSAVFTSLDIESWHLKQQNGLFSRNDHQVFVKPALAINWRLSSRSMLLVSSKRQIHSLNFKQMVFNFDLDDEIVDVGSLSIVPEKNWLSTLFVEKRVFEQKGKLRLGGFYRMIEDHIERVPTPGGGSGPGNIGDAYVRGMQLVGRYHLLKKSDVSAMIKLNFTLQHSAVTDPFTGEERPLRGIPGKIVKLELRQEFPNTSLDYVLDMTWRSDTYFSDKNYQEIRSLNRPVTNLKGRYRVDDDLQVWLEVRGLFGIDEFRSREKFTGDRSLSQVSRYDQSRFYEGRQFTVGLQGYF